MVRLTPKRSQRRKVKRLLDRSLELIRRQGTTLTTEQPAIQRATNPLPLIRKQADPIITTREDFTVSIADNNGHTDIWNESECDESELIDSCTGNVRFRDKLAQWATTHNISHIALKQLLCIVREDFPDLDIPVDPRTLLKTPRHLNIVEQVNGQFYHFGIVRSLSKLQKCDILIDDGNSKTSNSLTLKVGIDGLPISRSSRLQFWPILFSVDQDKFKRVFVASIFYGKEKPNDLRGFLGPFVAEMLSCMSSTINIDGLNYNVKVRIIVADAPARSFIKCIKGHNAYFGCERCYRRGSWKRRVIYPIKPLAELYSDQSFSERWYECHHNGYSPLEDLEIGMISQIPLDYMHLCCLGIMKKLLLVWTEGPLPHKLSNKQIKCISERLVLFRDFIPSNFSRKCRGLNELRYWKATEFRLFMLYLGPFALKNVLSKQLYDHFMLYHVSMYILISDCRNKSEWIDFAEECLRSFVEQVPKLYFKEMLVYNMHSLLHLASEVRLHGPLDNFSAFEFENFMQPLKKMLRANSKHLSQVVGRITELENCNIKQNVPVDESRRNSNQSFCNSCFLTKNNKVCVVTKHSSPKLCKYFRSVANVETYPLDSNKLQILHVGSLCQEEQELSINSLDRKCLILPDCHEMYFCIPLCNSRVTK